MSLEALILNRPVVDTFDSGYEHSLEHLLELKKMLAEDMEEAGSVTVAAKSAAVASPAA